MRTQISRRRSSLKPLPHRFQAGCGVVHKSACPVSLGQFPCQRLRSQRRADPGQSRQPPCSREPHRWPQRLVHLDCWLSLSCEYARLVQPCSTQGPPVAPVWPDSAEEPQWLLHVKRRTILGLMDQEALKVLCQNRAVGAGNRCVHLLSGRDCPFPCAPWRMGRDHVRLDRP